MTGAQAAYLSAHRQYEIADVRAAYEVEYHDLALLQADGSLLPPTSPVSPGALLIGRRTFQRRYRDGSPVVDMVTLAVAEPVAETIIEEAAIADVQAEERVDAIEDPKPRKKTK
jgi:hypothetical protein